MKLPSASQVPQGGAPRQAASALLACLGLLAGCPQTADDDSGPLPEDDDSVLADDDSALVDDDSAGDDDTTPGVVHITDRMLVVYNAGEPESLAVAEYYAQARGLPVEALCPTSPGATDVIDASVYGAGVALPVLDCIGGEWDRWLILVTVWGMPFRVSGAVRDIAVPANVVPASLDALLARPHHHDELPLSPGYSPYYRQAASMDGSYEDGVPVDLWREESGQTFYLVARLDGPAPDVARRLVDDAIAAEQAAAEGALVGTAWVDRGWQERVDDDTFGSYGSVEWDLTRLAEVFAAAGLEVVYDENPEEVGTAPAPLLGEDALYYGGWYSFDNYNDVWDWNFGAISVHFDSCSACDPRGGTNWSSAVLQRGAVATMGAVAEPYVAGLMAYDQFYLYLLQGFSFAEAGYMATPVSEWMAVFLGDPLYRPYGAGPLLPLGWQPGQRQRGPGSP